MSTFVRFWSKVQIGTSKECWPWKAYIKPNGYGSFKMAKDGKSWSVYAHRQAWELAFGPIPDKQNILHHCDNRACCNPNHLFIGTHKDNVRDSVQKRRHWKFHPEDNPQVKLTADDIREIRRLRNKERLKLRIIASRFNVTEATVSLVARRKIWKHI